MARKKRARHKTSNVKRKKKVVRQTEARRTQNRALIAILALLLLLHLIDEKTFDSVASTVNPRKQSKRKRGRGHSRVKRERKTQSRKVQYSRTVKWAIVSSTVCRCGSGKRPLGFCNECGMNYCSECQFTHLYQPPPMKTSDSIASNLNQK